MPKNLSSRHRRLRSTRLKPISLSSSQYVAQSAHDAGEIRRCQLFERVLGLCERLAIERHDAVEHVIDLGAPFDAHGLARAELAAHVATRRWAERSEIV